MLLEKLYYVHRISAPADTQDDENIQKYFLYLLPIIAKEENIVEEVETWPYVFVFDKNQVKSKDEMTITYFQRKTSIYEGCFVKIVNGIIENANSTKLAKKYIFDGNKYRNDIKKYRASSSSDITGTVANVCSYHINVGHGNTSIIAFQENGICHLWMIDCAYKEIKTRKNYQQNVDACFNYIKNKYNLEEIKIEKLLITHVHYDHISTVAQLIQKGYFADNLEVWFNSTFACSTKTYLDMINKLKNYADVSGINCKIIDPIVFSSQRTIEVLYPQTSYTGTHLKTANRAPDGKINNASVVYKINLAGHSMIFTGDIEEKGWKEIRNYHTHIIKPNYYCISHHGSINGHDPAVWCSQYCGLFDDNYCCKGMDAAILMGRDGFYRGIFSPTVINYYARILHATERSEHFIEIEWQSGLVNEF